MSKSSHAQLVTSRGPVKGRIDWWETYRERLAHGHNDRSIHRFREPFRLYDLPENRLVKHLVTTVDALCAEIGVSTPLEEPLVDPSEIQRWTLQIEHLRFLCGRYLRNVYMHQISLPSAVTGRMLYAARTARNPAYGEVGQAYELLRDLVLAEDLCVLRDTLEQVVLEPMQDEILYELHILFATMEAFEQHGWRGKRLRLIGRGSSGAIAEYENREAMATVKVWYQRLPPLWDGQSQYTDLLRHYDLDVQTRLPDIIVEIQKGHSVAWLLVEVKLSQDRGYIVDSVYKVLGYLKDFGPVFEGQINPQAFLAVWDGVARVPGRFPEDEIVIATHTNYGICLMEGVQSLLAQLPEAVAVA